MSKIAITNNKNAQIVGVPLDDPRFTIPISQEIYANGKVKRNTFACTNCHSVKQKCIPSDKLDIYRKACKRCLKLDKSCKFDLSKRTRKKKKKVILDISSSNTSESSKTTDMTTKISSFLVPGSLNNDRTELFTHGSSSLISIWQQQRSLPQPWTINKCVQPLLHDSFSHQKSFLKEEVQKILIYQKNKLEITSEKLLKAEKQRNQIPELIGTIPLHTDPIVLGIISSHDAEYRLKLYNEMSERFKLPFVRLPPNLTLDQFRRKYPILFSAVLSVSSVIIPHSSNLEITNMKIDSFILSLICHYAFKTGERSMELLKSLLVLCIWYNFPEWTHKTRYNFFNYICCCLARDLSSNLRQKLHVIDDNGNDYNGDKQMSIHIFPDEDASDPRIFLLTYISSLNISIFLCEPIQLKWSPIFDAVCRDLLNRAYTIGGEYNRENDEIFIIFAKLNHCLEIIHTKIHESYDLKYLKFDKDEMVRSLQHELDQVFISIPKSRHRVLSFFYSVEAYMYESVVSDFFSDIKDKSRIDSVPKKIEDAFIKCAGSCINALKEFDKFSPELVASLPLFHISRMIYTLGMALIKLRFVVITIPAFHHLKKFTEDILFVVNNISQLLDKTTQMFPYNNISCKLQYVCALFTQTYANKLTKFLDFSQHTVKHNLEPQYGIVPDLLFNNNPEFKLSMTNQSINTNNEKNVSNKVINSSSNIRSNNHISIPSFDNISKFNLNSHNEVLESDNSLQNILNDELTEHLANSELLETGFCALNGEFWSDMFADTM